jgi:small basic protein (TIGR04137 family)
MSIDKSLKRKSGIVQVRSVLTRVERITKMKETDKWVDGMSPYGIPKTRVQKVMLKKPKKAKAAEGEEAAAPAAGGKAAAAAPKKDEKKK